MTPVSLCICEFQLHHHRTQASQRKYTASESRISSMLEAGRSRKCQTSCEGDKTLRTLKGLAA